MHDPTSKRNQTEEPENYRPETDFSESFDQTAIFSESHTESPRLRRIYRPTKLRHTKRRQDPAKIAGGKKKFQPPPARGAGYVRDLDLGLIWKERYLSNYTSSPPHRMPLSPHYCWPRMPLF